jgi:hypothetical protein
MPGCATADVSSLRTEVATARAEVEALREAGADPAIIDRAEAALAKAEAILASLDGVDTEDAGAVATAIGGSIGGPIGAVIGLAGIVIGAATRHMKSKQLQETIAKASGIVRAIDSAAEANPEGWTSIAPTIRSHMTNEIRDEVKKLRAGA